MPTRDHTPETHFVGDSQTADSLESLAKAMEAGFADIRQQLDHFTRHDRAFPTQGCTYCGVPSAA